MTRLPTAQKQLGLQHAIQGIASLALFAFATITMAQDVGETGNPNDHVEHVMALVEVSETGELLNYRLYAGISYIVNPEFRRFIERYDYPVPRDADDQPVARSGRLRAVYRYRRIVSGDFHVYHDDQDLRYFAVDEEKRRLLRSSNPRYPLKAMEKQTEGWVEVHYRIAPDGRVKDLAIIGESPPGAFGRHVLRAVRKWRFEPVSNVEVAASVDDYQIIEFKLDL